jgi:hypothetical protein
MAEIFPFISREYDGAFAVQKYALLDMPLQRAGEHRTFDIAPCGGAVFGAQGMGHTGNVLLNDRILVQLLGNVMGGGADEFDAAIMRLLIGLGPPDNSARRSDEY